MANLPIHLLLLLVLVLGNGAAAASRVARLVGAASTSPRRGLWRSLLAADARRRVGGIGVGLCEEEKVLQVRPGHKARAIGFRDKDTAQGILSGSVHVSRADSEDDVIWYTLCWASNGTRVRGPIQTLPKTGGDLLFELHDPNNPSKGRRLPSGVNQLMVVTASCGGEMDSGPTVDIVDRVELPIKEIFRDTLRGGLM
uniref:Uncharacterized protein n=1 Tax=Pyrodinium bahamense TaxID=73915 RepID=A0A7S0AAJ8_9DINO